MKGALLFVCLLSVVSADGQFKKFFGKFAAMKMLSACFGEDFMMDWTKNFTAACEFCNMQSSENYLRDFPLVEYPMTQIPMQYPDNEYDGDEDIALNQDNLAQFFQQAQIGGAGGYHPSYPSQFPAYIPQTGGFPSNTAVYNLPNIIAALQGNLTHPILLVPLPSYPGAQGFYKRQKRGIPEIDATTINNVYQKIRSKAGNFTCLMKTLNFFDKDFDVNVRYQMSLITDLDIDAELKSDLFESMTDCIRFASCKPLDRRSLMPPAVQRAISYMVCENKMTLASCVKNDLMRNQEKFDLDALNELPAGSDTDIGDKMLAILWGKFSGRRS